MTARRNGPILAVERIKQQTYEIVEQKEQTNKSNKVTENWLRLSHTQLLFEINIDFIYFIFLLYGKKYIPFFTLHLTFKWSNNEYDVSYVSGMHCIDKMNGCCFFLHSKLRTHLVGPTIHRRLPDGLPENILLP